MYYFATLTLNNILIFSIFLCSVTFFFNKDVSEKFFKVCLSRGIFILIAMLGFTVTVYFLCCAQNLLR